MPENHVNVVLSGFVVWSVCFFSTSEHSMMFWFSPLNKVHAALLQIRGIYCLKLEGPASPATNQQQPQKSWATRFLECSFIYQNVK